MEGYALPPHCLPGKIWQCLETVLVVTVGEDVGEELEDATGI